MNTDEIKNRVYTKQGMMVVAMLLIVLAVIGLEFLSAISGIEHEPSQLFEAIALLITGAFFNDVGENGLLPARKPKQEAKDLASELKETKELLDTIK